MKKSIITLLIVAILGIALYGGIKRFIVDHTNDGIDRLFDTMYGQTDTYLP